STEMIAVLLILRPSFRSRRWLLSGFARAARARDHHDGRGRVELVDRGRLVEERQRLRRPVAGVVVLRVVQVPEGALAPRKAEDRWTSRVRVPPRGGEVLVAAHVLLVRESVDAAVPRACASRGQRRVIGSRAALGGDREVTLLERFRREVRAR